jgi:hypothetical protein
VATGTFNVATSRQAQFLKFHNIDILITTKINVKNCYEKVAVFSAIYEFLIKLKAKYD